MPAVIVGAAGLQHRLAAIADPAMRKGFTQRLMLRTIAAMKQRIPRKTSTTSRSLRVGAQNEDHATIIGNVLALWLDQGTRAHEIRPKKRKALRWAASPAGRRLSGRVRTAAQRGELGGVAFAKVVHHPGTRGSHYILPSLQEGLRKSGIKDDVISAWNKAD